MATLILSAYHVRVEARGGHNYVSVVFHLDGKPDPMARRLVEIRNTKDALAALDQYRAEAIATGQSMALSMRIKDGERSPNGFKAATANNHFIYVNC